MKQENKLTGNFGEGLAGRDVPCRIDMVAVVLDSQNRVERITHHENLI